MKKLYIILLFLVFINIFNFMFVAYDIFPSGFEGQSDSYDIADADENTTSGEELFEQLSDADFGDLMLLFFGQADTILAFIVTASIAIAAAWLTKSPAPFVVAMIGGTFLTLYYRSTGIFEQFPINGFVMLACSVGIVILFVITCAETLAPGGNT